MTTKLEKLLQKEAQLKAQIQQAKAAERTLEKKRDTRRKILIGAAVLARVQAGEWPKADLLMMMDGFLTRPNERDLFELDEPEADKSKAATAAKKMGTAGQKADKSKARKLPESDLDIDKEFNL